MTVLGMVTAAVKRLGVIDEDQVLTASQAVDGMDRLNDYIDDVLHNDRLTIFSITRTVFTLTNGTSSYTVGTGGDVNVSRPPTMNMEGCNVTFIDTSTNPANELQLWPLTDDTYQAINQKTLQATYPTSWYFNPTYTSSVAPYATLTFWPVPNVSTLQGVFYAPLPVSEFTALTQTIALPPGYRRFLRDNLAVEIAPEYNTTPSQSLMDSARESKASVMKTNTRLVDLAVDLALTPRRWRSNIYCGP